MEAGSWFKIAEVRRNWRQKRRPKQHLWAAIVLVVKKVVEVIEEDPMEVLHTTGDLAAILVYLV